MTPLWYGIVAVATVCALLPIGVFVREFVIGFREGSSRVADNVSPIGRTAREAREQRYANDPEYARLWDEQQAHPDYLALLNLEEAVRCMLTHRNWMECGKVEKALENLNQQRQTP